MLNTLHHLLPLFTHPFMIFLMAICVGGFVADQKGWPRR